MGVSGSCAEAANGGSDASGGTGDSCVESANGRSFFCSCGCGWRGAPGATEVTHPCVIAITPRGLFIVLHAAATGLVR